VTVDTISPHELAQATLTRLARLDPSWEAQNLTGARPRNPAQPQREDVRVAQDLMASPAASRRKQTTLSHEQLSLTSPNKKKRNRKE